MVRIIAGHLRSRRIETPEGLATRPTTDRVREAVFSKVHHLMPNARVLDLFSGSGAIGMEAVSRGAKEAVLVDKSRDCCALIRKNLEKLAIRNAQVINLDYKSALSKLAGQTFDFIYIDPPYDEIPVDDVFLEIDKNGIRFGMLAAECKTLPKTRPVNALSEDIRKYGKTQIIFYKGEGEA
ncbi:MAG: 16S rRNA (guanine(966)-N(2))-methyltransferase RsmD [Christensenellales bacterium]